MSRRAQIKNDRLQRDMTQISYGFYMAHFYDVGLALDRFMGFKPNPRGTTRSRRHYDSDKATICIFDRPKQEMGRQFHMSMVDISSKAGWYIAEAGPMSGPVEMPEQDVLKQIAAYQKRNVI
jgi:hypothetical protein